MAGKKALLTISKRKHLCQARSGAGAPAYTLSLAAMPRHRLEGRQVFADGGNFITAEQHQQRGSFQSMPSAVVLLQTMPHSA